jgi:hypothetical protein
VASDLALEFPGFAVHVEDPVAEEVFEGYVEKVLSLAVVVEDSLEDVLDDSSLAVNTYVWIMPTLWWRM